MWKYDKTLPKTLQYQLQNRVVVQKLSSVVNPYLVSVVFGEASLRITPGHLTAAREVPVQARCTNHPENKV